MADSATVELAGDRELRRDPCGVGDGSVVARSRHGIRLVGLVRRDEGTRFGRAASSRASNQRPAVARRSAADPAGLTFCVKLLPASSSSASFSWLLPRVL